MGAVVWWVQRWGLGPELWYLVSNSSRNWRGGMIAGWPKNVCNDVVSLCSFVCSRKRNEDNNSRWGGFLLICKSMDGGTSEMEVLPWNVRKYPHVRHVQTLSTDPLCT